MKTHSPTQLGMVGLGRMGANMVRRLIKDQYELNLADVAEVWRRGSVVASWLLDLTADALVQDPALSKFAGRVSDSGEGRWTIKAAIDEGVPVPVLTSALYERFSSRGNADFQEKLLSAMRYEFGGHMEKSAK
jgi:6-phosphogluconate dehydrogenase